MTRAAHTYQMGICNNPKCRCIHLELVDEDDRVFGVCLINVKDVPSMTEKMRDIAYQIVTTKGEIA